MNTLIAFIIKMYFDRFLYTGHTPPKMAK